MGRWKVISGVSYNDIGCRFSRRATDQFSLDLVVSSSNTLRDMRCEQTCEQMSAGRREEGRDVQGHGRRGVLRGERGGGEREGGRRDWIEEWAEVGGW